MLSSWYIAPKPQGMRVFAIFYPRCRKHIVQRLNTFHNANLFPRMQSKPEDCCDRLGVAYGSIARHPDCSRKRKETYSDKLIFFRLRFACSDSARQIHRHSFIKEPWANVKPQNALPTNGGVAGFFEQLALGSSELIFSLINLSCWQLP